jgi:hypothetical protein
LYHFFLRKKKNQVQTELFSEVNLFSTAQTVHFQTEVYQVENIRGSITYEYDRNWWLARVFQVNNSEIQLTSSHSSGSNISYVYSLLPDILWIPASKVLTKVDP